MSEEMTNSELRDAWSRVKKDNAGLQKNVEDLTQKIRVSEAQEAFRDAGYTPANGVLYATVNPEGEITADAVKAFATEQGLTLVADLPSDDADSGDTTSDVKDGSTALAGLAGSGSRAGEGGAGGASTEVMTRQAWQQLHAVDPAAAKAAITSGRVEISRDNVYAKGPGLPKGVNPYALASDTN